VALFKSVRSVFICASECTYASTRRNVMQLCCDKCIYIYLRTAGVLLGQGPIWIQLPVNAETQQGCILIFNHLFLHYFHETTCLPAHDSQLCTTDNSGVSSKAQVTTYSTWFGSQSQTLNIYACRWETFLTIIFETLVSRRSSWHQNVRHLTLISRSYYTMWLLRHGQFWPDDSSKSLPGTVPGLIC